MAGYPMRDVPPEKSNVKTDSNIGSITRVKTEPDFEKFKKEDWVNYNHKKMHNENDVLKGVLGAIVLFLIFYLILR